MLFNTPAFTESQAIRLLKIVHRISELTIPCGVAVAEACRRLGTSSLGPADLQVIAGLVHVLRRGPSSFRFAQARAISA
jgi:hypothetical protein